MVGPPFYEALHGMKRGMKDMLAPQGMFEDLGLKYVGPVDGHDVAAVEHALRLARGFGGPVIVHCVTRKGYGYAPAENDEADQMHQSRGFDPATGLPTRPRRPDLDRRCSPTSWCASASSATTSSRSPRRCASRPGSARSPRRFPDRCYDVGIAEQHALTSAAGLATGGLHPVVALYATFLNRAFDQLLMDVALHRLPVTFVLDRAGVTGEDGPSHNGMWDLAMLGVVPGLRIAAPRDEPTLRPALAEAVERSRRADRAALSRRRRSAPTCRRCARSAAVDVLAEPDVDATWTCCWSRSGRWPHDVLEAGGGGRRGRLHRPGRRPALGHPGAPALVGSRAGRPAGRHGRGRRGRQRGRRADRPGAARRRASTCRPVRSAFRSRFSSTARSPRSGPRSGLTRRTSAGGS